MTDIVNNFIQIFNEAVVLTSQWLMFLFTDYVDSPETRYTFGWYFLYFLAADVALNVLVLLYILSSKVWTAGRRFHLRKKALEMAKRRVQDQNEKSKREQLKNQLSSLPLAMEMQGVPEGGLRRRPPMLLQISASELSARLDSNNVTSLEAAMTRQTDGNIPVRLGINASLARAPGQEKGLQQLGIASKHGKIGKKAGLPGADSETQVSYLKQYETFVNGYYYDGYYYDYRTLQMH